MYEKFLCYKNIWIWRDLSAQYPYCCYDDNGEKFIASTIEQIKYSIDNYTRMYRNKQCGNGNGNGNGNGATFAVGLGIHESECDATLENEGTTFEAYEGNWILMFALYRLGSCNPVPEGDYIWYRRKGESTAWNEISRYYCPAGGKGYSYGYVHITDDAGGWDYKVTYAGKTAYFKVTTDVSADGRIISCNYPSKVVAGSQYIIELQLENNGEQPGTFKVRLKEGTSVLYESSTFSMAPGNLPTLRDIFGTMPNRNLSLEVELILIT